MRRVLFITLITCAVTATQVYGQTRQTRPRVITKRAKAAVIIPKKSVDPPAESSPTESDDGNWNTFVLNEDSLEMLFPATHQNIQDETLGRIRSLQATTSKASYMLAVRELGTPISIEGLDTFLNEVAKNTYGERGTKLVDHHNISYAGRVGKEFTTERNSHRTISRLYVLNGKLFVMSVTLDQKDYDQTSEKWIAKFFDSFRVQVPIFNEA